MQSDTRTSRRAFLAALAATGGGVALGGFRELEGRTVDGLRRFREATDTLGPGPGGSPGSGTAALNRLREEYLLDPGIHYLNHASIGTVPRTVHEARVGYARLCETNPWLYMWGPGWADAKEEVRRKAAGLLGAHPDEVAITHNTTEGFNLLARGLPLGPGDEVLFTSLNHPSAANPWYRYGPERGYSVRMAELPLARSAEITGDELVALHLDAIGPATRVLVFPHVDNVVGFHHPLEALAAGARARGVEFVAVDGAQSAGMIPLSLSESGIDFFAASPHKWIQSPKGLGLFYARRETLESVTPLWVRSTPDRFAGSARMFEDYNTRNMPELLALGDALDVQEALGATWKAQRYRELRGHLQGLVHGSTGLRWRSAADPGPGIPLMAVERVDAPAAELGTWLWEEHGVVVRSFGAPPLNTLRISPNTFTTEDELNLLVELMEAFPG